MDILAGRVFRDTVSDDGALIPVQIHRVPGTVGAVAPVHDDEGWVLGNGSGLQLPASGWHGACPGRCGAGLDSDERCRM